MLTLEVDGLEEVDNSLREQLKKAGFDSVRDIVIRGPVQVAKLANLEMEEASDICNKASLLLEKSGVIPNGICEVHNNNFTSKKEYIKTGSSEMDSLFGGKGI